MRFYSEKEPIPAAVVTLATQESNRQHILFQTKYDQEGFYSLSEKEDIRDNQGPCAEKLEWAIKAVTVSLFRDWSTSTARIHLVCNIKEASGKIPSFPKVNRFRGGQYPYLTVDDEIRIYAGYIASPNEQIEGHMLDEIPFPILKDEFSEKENKTVSIPMDDIPQPDKNKKLIPIFWGFIDKIDFDGSAKGSGLQCVISCRDRTRVFSDTTIINIPSLNGVFNSQGNSTNLPQGRLSQLVADVARSVNGYQVNLPDAEQQGLNCWKTIITPNPALNEEGEENRQRNADIPAQKEDNTTDTENTTNNNEETEEETIATALNDIKTAANFCEYYSAYDSANNNERLSATDRALADNFTADPALFVRRASFKIMDVLSRPRFHMWLSRPPMAKNGEGNAIQILDQSPLKIIKWIATKEERPTDFFASHVNGDFCLVPRVLDTSGFRDEMRMYRTYFFRDWPKLSVKRDEQNNIISTEPISPPCRNQLLLNLRSYTSIIGTYNRFTVVDNSNVSGAGLALLQGVKITIDRLPFILDGGPSSEEGGLDTTRRPAPPCRQKLIYDGNLANYNNSFGAALIVAQQYSSHLSRDMSGVEFTILGDPTFFPGEAVRIYNTFLHDMGYQTNTGSYLDTVDKHIATEEFLKTWVDSAPDSAGVNNTGTQERAALVNESDSLKIKKLQETGTQITNIEDTSLRLPVYKVRSIEHKITTTGRNAGFTTIISASMDTHN